MKKLLDIQNVSLQFPQLDQPILNNINYSVCAEDFVIILGSNGSGKSSLFKLVDGRYDPSAGKIFLDEKLLTHYSEKQFSRSVKTLTQSCHDSLFMSLTVLENYLLVKQQYEANLFSLRHASERNFLINYLLQFNPNLVTKLDQPVEYLSGGEKQALALALIVLYPPRILLLDEHTSALDPKSAENLMSLTQRIVKQHKITCMLTTHDLAIAEQYGNRILALKNGKVHHCIEQDEKIQLAQAYLLAACY